jgi:hypothetical protein
MSSATLDRPTHTMDAREQLAFDAARLPPDAETIDRLLKLQMVAHRIGLELVLCNPSRHLRELISFAGLADVLRVEVQRETEQRKERGRVEEERELDDPAR